MLPVSAAAWLPVLSFRSKMATFAPAVRSALTVASPSPEAPPVTTAAREASIFIAGSLGLFKEQILSYFSILAASSPHRHCCQRIVPVRAKRKGGACDSGNERHQG